MRTYRGYEIESYKDNVHDGYIVCLWGDEIYCDSLADAEKVIDEYLEEE